GRNGSVFALGIDNKGRPFVKQQVRDDQRDALARPASCNGQYMPVIVPADEPLLSLAEEQTTLAVAPDPSVHFRGLEPSSSKPASLGGFQPARKIVPQLCLEIGCHHCPHLRNA